MKKIFVFAFAFAALFMGVSCTQDGLRDESAPEAPVTVERVPVTIRAGFGDSVLSRTYLDGHTVKWSASDQIGIIDAECAAGASDDDKAAAIQTFSITERSADNTTATFSGSLAPGMTNYYAVYPYNAQDFYNPTNGIRNFFSSGQTASAPGTFNDSYNPAVALLKDGALAFKNIGGLFKFTLETDNVKKVTITANDGGTVGGVYYIKLDSSGEISSVTLASTRTAVNFTPAGGGTFAVGTYYVAVSARTYTGGINLALTLSDDSIKNRGTTADVVVERSKVTSLGSINPNVDPFKPVNFPVVFNLGFSEAEPTLDTQGYNYSGQPCMAEWISAGLYGKSSAATTAGENGKWLCRTQPQAYMTFTWADAITATGAPHFTEVATTRQTGTPAQYVNISTPGVKGLWTGDYFEFVLPVRDFDANTTIRLTMPIYTRCGPTFWEVKYLDGGVWNTTATAGLPAYDGAAVTATATWAVPYLAVTSTTDNLQTVDLPFTSAVAEGELKVRVQCVDGSICSSGVNAVVTGKTAPYPYTGATCSAPFYFYNPGNRTSQAITFTKLP